MSPYVNFPNLDRWCQCDGCPNRIRKQRRSDSLYCSKRCQRRQAGRRCWPRYYARMTEDQRQRRREANVRYRAKKKAAS